MDVGTHTHDDVSRWWLARASDRAMRAGRSLLHPDIAVYEAIAESNKRECDAIDKHYAKLYSRQTSTGAHSDKRDKKRYAPPTMHDLAANNPILRDLLRRMHK